MPMHTAKLVLEIPLSSLDGPIDPSLGTALEDYLRDWSEGRYPFDVELLYHTLKLCLESAAAALQRGRLHAKYGNEMVDLGNGSRASRWYMEHQNTPIRTPWVETEAKVRIEYANRDTT